MSINLITREDILPVIERLDKLAQMYTSFTQSKSWGIYTNEKAAMLLGVSKRTLQNWRDDGLITYTQIGNKIYYTQEAIQDLLDGNRKEAFAKKAKGGNHER